MLDNLLILVNVKTTNHLKHQEIMALSFRCVHLFIICLQNICSKIKFHCNGKYKKCNKCITIVNQCSELCLMSFHMKALQTLLNCTTVLLVSFKSEYWPIHLGQKFSCQDSLFLKETDDV